MNDITQQIVSAMQQYSGIIEEEIETALKDVGKQTVQKVKSLAPVRTGEYKRGWTVTVKRKAGNVEAVVYNRKHYRRTHLLENGHKTRSGGRTRPQPHIAPAEEFAEAEAMKAIERAVKG